MAVHALLNPLQGCKNSSPHRDPPPRVRVSAWPMSGLSFAQEGQIDAIMAKLKAHLGSSTSELKRMFDKIDTDRSNELTIDEFQACLKEADIVLPASQLRALTARFDLSGDGSISIPEFMAFMSGDANQIEALKQSNSVSSLGGSKMSSSQMPSSPAWPGRAQTATPQARGYGGLYQQPHDFPPSERMSRTSLMFLARVEGDLETRRRNSFINELRAHPPNTRALPQARRRGSRPRESRSPGCPALSLVCATRTRPWQGRTRASSPPCSSRPSLGTSRSRSRPVPTSSRGMTARRQASRLPSPSSGASSAATINASYLGHKFVMSRGSLCE